MEQLEWTQILPMAKCMGCTANIAKLVLTFDCGNGETIYTFKLYNLPELLTYEARTKQLALPHPILDQTTTITLSALRVNYC